MPYQTEAERFLAEQDGMPLGASATPATTGLAATESLTMSQQGVDNQSGAYPDPGSPHDGIHSGIVDPEDDRFFDGGRGLSSLQLRAKIERIENQMDADEEVERQKQEEEEDRMLMMLVVQKHESTKTEREFLDQERFRWSVPDECDAAAVIPSKVEDGVRARPAIQHVQQKVPPAPPAFLPFEEQEAQYGERYSALQMKREGVYSQRLAAEFDMEETLFAIPSSDDSDGYDEDYEDLWGELTSEIYSVCRPLECNPSDDAAATGFGKMIERLAQEKTELNTAEQQLIWNCIRYTYQAAEPIHAKHWLKGCHEITNTANFKSRPSVANFAYIIQKAKRLTCLPPRQRAKIEGWAARCSYLVRKRIVVLQEFGKMEPTWSDINASVGDLSRSTKVPTMTMGDTLTALTAASEVTAASTNVASSWKDGYSAQKKQRIAEGTEVVAPSGEIVDLFD